MLDKLVNFVLKMIVLGITIYVGIVVLMWGSLILLYMLGIIQRGINIMVKIKRRRKPMTPEQQAAAIERLA